MSQLTKYIGTPALNSGHELVRVSSNKNSELSLINEKEPLLNYIDLIIKYAVKTGDFGQYTSLNIVASELGDFMVNTITEYKNASHYNDIYKMEDILQKSTNEIISFISVLSQFIVCQEDIKKQQELICGLGDLFTERYNHEFFKTVVRDTYDIDNERVYWEKIKYKMHSIYEKNMNIVLKRREAPALPWYKKLFITDVEREEKKTDYKKTISQLCIQYPQKKITERSAITKLAPVVTSQTEQTINNMHQRRMSVRKGHQNIAKLQNRAKGY